MYAGIYIILAYPPLSLNNRKLPIPWKPMFSLFLPHTIPV